MSDTALRTAPDQELRSKLDRVSCSALLDALLDRYAHPSHILDLVSPTPGRVLFGPAVTISYFPSCSAGLVHAPAISMTRIAGRAPHPTRPAKPAARYCSRNAWLERL